MGDAELTETYDGTCPACGYQYEESDLFDITVSADGFIYDEGDGDEECPQCGADLHFTVSVSYHFTISTEEAEASE